MMAKKGPNRGVVSTSNSVRIYGQVNRAVRFASTPSRSDFQSVDNGESNSRFGMLATTKLTESVSGSAQLEIGWHGNGRGADFDGMKGAGITFRHSTISVSHKDMGTLSLGHSTIAGGGSYFQSFAGTGLAFGVGGAANDGITATKGDIMDKPRYGAPFGLFAHRRGRLLYRTPALMGVTVEGSYNEGGSDDDWSAGLTLSGLPGVKAVGVRAGVGYRDHGGGTTTLGMSGGVQHNASGLSVNGWYAKEKNESDPDKSGWMGDVSWTGNVIDSGATSLTVSYGQWKLGMHGTTTRYFAAINQRIAGAATDIYFGVSYDTGDVEHTVMHKDSNTYALHAASGENRQQDGRRVFKGDDNYAPLYDVTEDGDNRDKACGDVMGAADAPTADEVAAHNGTKCAVNRDGVFILIAGVRIRF